jgi:hypothetical protein
MFAESCSYLHNSFNRGDHTSSDGLHEIVQAVSVLREEVKTLRLEINRLLNVNQKRLLEVIKDLKEEFDVDKIKRLGNDSRVSLEHMTRPKVEHLCLELAATDETDKVARMVDSIEQLQFHENEMIYLQALDII